MPIDSKLMPALGSLFTSRQVRLMTQFNYTAESDRRVGTLRKDQSEQWAVQWYGQYRVVLFQRAEKLRHQLNMAYAQQLDAAMLRRIVDPNSNAGDSADPNKAPVGGPSFVAPDSNKRGPDGVTQIQWWQQDTAMPNPLGIPSLPGPRPPLGGLGGVLGSLLNTVIGSIGGPMGSFLGGVAAGGEMPLFQDVAYGDSILSGQFPASGNMAPTAIAYTAANIAASVAGGTPPIIYPRDVAFWLPRDPPNSTPVSAGVQAGLASALHVASFIGAFQTFIPVNEIIGGSLTSLMHGLLGPGMANTVARTVAAGLGGALGGGLPSSFSDVLAFPNDHDVDFYEHKNQSAFAPPVFTGFTAVLNCPIPTPAGKIPFLGINLFTQWINFYNGFLNAEEASQNIYATYARHILRQDYTRDTSGLNDPFLEADALSDDASHFRNFNFDGSQPLPKDGIWDGTRPLFQKQDGASMFRNTGGHLPFSFSPTYGQDELQPPSGGDSLLRGGGDRMAINGPDQGPMQEGSARNTGATSQGDANLALPSGTLAIAGSNSPLFSSPLDAKAALNILDITSGMLGFGSNVFATNTTSTGRSTLSTRTPQVGAKNALGNRDVEGWESWKDQNPMPQVSLMGMLPGEVMESFAHSIFQSDLFHYSGGWTNISATGDGCNTLFPTGIFPESGDCPFSNNHWDTGNWIKAPLKLYAAELSVATGIPISDVDLQQDGGVAKWLLTSLVSGGNSTGGYLGMLGRYLADLAISNVLSTATGGLAQALAAGLAAIPGTGQPAADLAIGTGVSGAIGALNLVLDPIITSLDTSLGSVASIAAANSPIQNQDQIRGDGLLSGRGPGDWNSRYDKFGDSGYMTRNYAIQEDSDGTNREGSTGQVGKASFQGDFRGVWTSNSNIDFGLGPVNPYGPTIPAIPGFFKWNDNPSADAEYDAHIREFLTPYLGVMRSPSFLPTLMYNLVNSRYYHYASSMTNGPAMRASGYRQGFQDTFDLGIENTTGLETGTSGMFGDFMQFLMPIAMFNIIGATMSGQDVGTALNNVRQFLTDGLVAFASLKAGAYANTLAPSGTSFTSSDRVTPNQVKNSEGNPVLAQSQGKFDRPTGGYWSTLNFLGDWNVRSASNEYWTWTEQQQDGGDRDMAFFLYKTVLRPHMLRAVEFYNDHLLPDYSVDNQYHIPISPLDYGNLIDPGNATGEFARFHGVWPILVGSPGEWRWNSQLRRTREANLYMTQYWMDSAFGDLKSNVPQYKFGTAPLPPSSSQAWKAGSGNYNYIPPVVRNLLGMAAEPAMEADYEEGPAPMSQATGLGVSSSRYTQFSARQTWNATAGNYAFNAATSNIAHVQNKWLSSGALNIEGNQSLAFDAGQDGGGDLDLTYNRDNLYKINFTSDVSGVSKAVFRAVDPMIGGGFRLAETKDIAKTGTWSEVSIGANNDVVNLMKRYISGHTTTDTELQRDYQDVFHMGFFDHVQISGQASDIGGGGVTSSLDVTYINRIIANRIVQEAAYFDLNDYYAAGGGTL